LAFTTTDWTVLIAAKNVLKSVFEAPKLLSGQKYGTMGISFIIIDSLEQYLTTLKKTEGPFEILLKQRLLTTFKYYFGESFISKEQYEASMV